MLYLNGLYLVGFPTNYQLSGSIRCNYNRFLGESSLVPIMEFLAKSFILQGQYVQTFLLITDDSMHLT